jgi:sulfoxide reductase heme-binding subunit YedZ
LASTHLPGPSFLAANYFYRRIGSTPSFSIANTCFPMSNQYTAISWNTQKRWYDIVLIAGIVLYSGTFIALSSLLHPSATAETLIIRAAGSCAFLLLTVVLCIGPLCRLDSRFLPLLYNRRHLGVATFLMGLVHGAFSLFQFHSLGVKDPLVSLWTSNLNYNRVADFPFQPLGFVALIILFLMAATSHDFWLRNLTPPVWKALHMLVYIAYALLVAHITLGLLQTERSWLLAIAVAISLAAVLSLHLAAAIRERTIDKATARESNQGFVLACSVDSIPDSYAKTVSLHGERIAIFKYAGNVSALSNVCRHQNGPLGEGKIIDGCITCPWHGYQYLPESGASPPPFTEKVSTFRTKIIDGNVWVDPNPLPPGTFIEAASIPPRGADEIQSTSDFYIGYLPQSPPSVRQRVCLFVIGCLVVLASIALLFASAQKHFANSTFESGKIKEFHGTLREDPYPILIGADNADGNSREKINSYLLVAPGKHGAEPLTEPYLGQSVHLKGTLIITGLGGKMIEVVPGTTNPDSKANPIENGATEIGERDLAGEIVDTKCFLGVMNPGEGKVHRECAALCLAGGIPPALFAQDFDGATKILLLTDPAGAPLAQSAYLQRIGQPVRVQGNVFVSNGLLYIRTSASRISALP